MPAIQLHGDAAVIQRETFIKIQMRQGCQMIVGAQESHSPAAELLVEQFAKTGVQVAQICIRRNPYTVGRIGHDPAWETRGR